MKSACKYTLNPVKVSWTFYLKAYLGLRILLLLIYFLTLKSFNNMEQISLTVSLLKRRTLSCLIFLIASTWPLLLLRLYFLNISFHFFSVASRHIFTVLCRWDTYERPVVSCSRHSSNKLCLGQCAPDLHKCLMNSFWCEFSHFSSLSFTNK